MSYLRYLCLFAHSGVQHILCILVLVYISISTISLMLTYEFLKLRTVVSSNLNFRRNHKM
jgi:hypothetical protein